MAYMAVTGPCIACGRIFTFSPSKVPSVRVEGEREPICERCVPRFNEVRAEQGLPLIVPLPGAYEPDEVP
jgi:hypothetical protein